MRTILPVFAISVAILACPVAQADDGFYAGFGADIDWGTSNNGGYTGYESTGAQMKVGPGMVHAEYIYDNFRHNLDTAQSFGTPAYKPDWEAHTGKVTYIFASDGAAPALTAA